MVVTLAGTLGLKGYVEILPDGKAFIIAEGPKEDLARFVRAIRRRHRSLETAGRCRNCKKSYP